MVVCYGADLAECCCCEDRSVSTTYGRGICLRSLGTQRVCKNEIGTISGRRQVDDISEYIFIRVCRMRHDDGMSVRRIFPLTYTFWSSRN